jgi:hypothetical protein
MIVGLLTEGFESALLPCSFVALVPGAAAVIAARQESTSAFAGFFVGMVALSFLRFSGRGGDLPPLVVAVVLAVAVVLLAIPLVRRLNIVTGTGGLLVGAAAGVLWEPCVGAEFADLVNTLPDRSLAPGLLLLTGYVVGVIAPVVVLAAALYLIPNSTLILARPVMLMIGCGTLAILSLATAAGFADDVIGKLVELSVA